MLAVLSKILKSNFKKSIRKQNHIHQKDPHFYKACFSGVEQWNHTFNYKIKDQRLYTSHDGYLITRIKIDAEDFQIICSLVDSICLYQHILTIIALSVYLMLAFEFQQYVNQVLISVCEGHTCSILARCTGRQSLLLFNKKELRQRKIQQRVFNPSEASVALAGPHVLHVPLTKLLKQRRVNKRKQNAKSCVHTTHITSVKYQQRIKR